ncbi:MAG TPA: type II toxin-antitoxin system PemK/MazF family toxin [Gemmatimonadaceae bacterium]
MGYCSRPSCRRADTSVLGAQEVKQKAQAVLKRYELRWAELDPVRGSEMAKTRPVVIVSLDVLNERQSTITVCPLTTQLHPSWRSRLAVQYGGQAAEIAADQMRTISKSRIGRKIGTLSDRDALTLRRLLTEMYGE